MNENLITIGQIISTHGHLGEVKVYPLTDFRERFELLKQVGCKLKDKFMFLTIDSVRYHRNFIILRFKEIENMNQAENLKDGWLQIERSQLMPLPAGTYYFFEIIGLRVYTTSDLFLGTVKSIQQTGSNDVYCVENEATGTEILIPALKQFVQEINLSAGKVIVHPIPGLIE